MGAPAVGPLPARVSAPLQPQWLSVWWSLKCSQHHLGFRSYGKPVRTHSRNCTPPDSVHADIALSALALAGLVLKTFAFMTSLQIRCCWNPPSFFQGCEDCGMRLWIKDCYARVASTRAGRPIRHLLRGQHCCWCTSRPPAMPSPLPRSGQGALIFRSPNKKTYLLHIHILN